MANLDIEKVKQFIDKEFDNNALPALMDYVRIPNLSKFFDKEWATNGLLEKAAKFLIDWVNKQNIKNAKVEFIQKDGLTPVIFIEIDGTTPNSGSIFLYGHYDKQPHMTGWLEGLGPTTPVIKDDKLYGRGASDDGYSIFAAILAVKACQQQNLPHSKIVVLIEGDEESSSKDLPYYLEMLKNRIGKTDLFVCLDSFTLDYETLWITSSLRGFVAANIKVKVLDEGVHSGDASGIVPSSFRIMRQILDRLENAQTGEVHESFQVNIPSDKYAQIISVAEKKGNSILEVYPWKGKMEPQTKDPVRALFNKTWKPSVAYIGMDGFPPIEIAGNVLRPESVCKVAMRIPPTLDPVQAAKDFKKIIEENPPYGAFVEAEILGTGSGFNAPINKEFFTESMKKASKNFYGKELGYYADGGSIPFLNLFQQKYPESSFAVIGVLGPNSNAHGPNEFLHIPYTKKLVCCLTQLIADSYISLKK